MSDDIRLSLCLRTHFAVARCFFWPASFSLFSSEIKANFGGSLSLLRTVPTHEPWVRINHLHRRCRLALSVFWASHKKSLKIVTDWLLMHSWGGRQETPKQRMHNKRHHFNSEVRWNTLHLVLGYLISSRIHYWVHFSPVVLLLLLFLFHAIHPDASELSCEKTSRYTLLPLSLFFTCTLESWSLSGLYCHYQQLPLLHTWLLKILSPTIIIFTLIFHCTLISSIALDDLHTLLEYCVSRTPACHEEQVLAALFNEI